MSDKQNRAGEIDLLRCLGIILMVMGHVGFGNIFDKYIHAFHMPMWFIISGFFVNTDRDIRSYIGKKFCRLMVPYFCFGTLYEIIQTIYGVDQWMGLLYPNSIQVPMNGALWFLPAMFTVDIIAFVILKYLSEKVAYVLMIVIAILGNIHPVSLPLSQDSAMVGVGFFLVGVIIKKYKFKILDMKVLYAILLLLGTSILIFTNGQVNVRENKYAFIPLFWINAIFITIAMWNICIFINRKYDLKIMKEVGAQSILYVCANQFILRILNKIPIPLEITWGGVLWNIVKVIIILMLCFVGTRIVMRTSLKVVLGR